jgi:Tol biopolymer transport system component
MRIFIKYYETKNTTYIFYISWMIVIGGFMYQQDCSADNSSGFSYAAISFTPDSQKLVFNRCQHQQPDNCNIHILDLKTKALSYYQPPANQEWYAAKFSPSGKHVVFVAAPLSPGYLQGEDKNKVYPDWGNAQIAIMDADGRNVRLLTNTKGYKMAPNFSWSGKKVLYVQGEMRKAGSKSVAAGFDAYEIDLESGNIRQLTDFKLFQMGRPSYLLGDEKFVVEASGPNNISGVDDYPAYWRNADKKYNNSWVYIFNANSGTQKLERLFGQLVSAASPAVDAQGSLYFHAQPSSVDRFKLFRVDVKGNLISWELPNMQPRYVEVSPDGRRWAVISKAASPDELNGIHVFDLASNKWEEISASAEAHLINP